LIWRIFFRGGIGFSLVGVRFFLFLSRSLIACRSPGAALLLFPSLDQLYAAGGIFFFSPIEPILNSGQSFWLVIVRGEHFFRRCFSMLDYFPFLSRRSGGAAPDFFFFFFWRSFSLRRLGNFDAVIPRARLSAFSLLLWGLRRFLLAGRSLTTLRRSALFY